MVSTSIPTSVLRSLAQVGGGQTRTRALDALEARTANPESQLRSLVTNIHQVANATESNAQRGVFFPTPEIREAMKAIEATLQSLEALPPGGGKLTPPVRTAWANRVKEACTAQWQKLSDALYAVTAKHDRTLEDFAHHQPMGELAARARNLPVLQAS